MKYSNFGKWCCIFNFICDIGSHETLNNLLKKEKKRISQCRSVTDIILFIILLMQEKNNQEQSIE